jgi:tRNA A37 threonylcarbamoyltransferase TsaD
MELINAPSLSLKLDSLSNHLGAVYCPKGKTGRQTDNGQTNQKSVQNKLEKRKREQNMAFSYSNLVSAIRQLDRQTAADSQTDQRMLREVNVSQPQSNTELLPPTPSF